MGGLFIYHVEKVQAPIQVITALSDGVQQVWYPSLAGCPAGRSVGPCPGDLYPPSYDVPGICSKCGAPGGLDVQLEGV